MLDLDAGRANVVPRDAATLLLVREARGGGGGIAVFCVERHQRSAFLGGAIVFPGGKVDDSDREPSWASLTGPAPRFAADEDEAVARAFGVAACREAMEEAAILLSCSGGPLSHPRKRGPYPPPVPPTHAQLIALRAALARREIVFRDAIAAQRLLLDLAALQPFARWVTPTAEARRFDTRFFLAVAPPGQEGAHDDHETTASFWAAP